DVDRHATVAFKEEGDVIVVLGNLKGSLGGSEYLALIHGLEIGSPPELDFELERRLQDLLVDVIAQGLVDTAHDTSEGGLAVALAEMSMAGGLGCDCLLPVEGRL